MGRGPNVLLVVFDTARADVLEPYGAPPGSSPAVSQLAAGGEVAPAAFATSSWTVPSHASLFTGLLPRAVGLGRGSAGTPQAYAGVIQSHRDRLLPTVLGRNGYVTSGVSANLWVSPESGFDTGFDTFHSVRSQRQLRLTDRSLRGRLRWTLEAVKARSDDGAAEVERVLADWRGRRDDRPFFWFVNLVECHSPYLPPKPYNDFGVVKRALAAADAQNHQTFAAFSKASLGGFDVSEPALERMLHLYQQSVLVMDDWLARILDGLDRHGVLDETLVLLTSDHGENFGECQLMGHAFSLDDRLIRIPLVASGPGAPRFAEVSSLVDLPRLIANAVGIDEHPWETRSDDGVAVAQLDAPCEPDDEVGYAAIEQLKLGPEAHRRLVTPLACATDGRHKLLRHGDEELLVDLASDPLEEAARPPNGNATVGRLRAALDQASGFQPAARPPTADATEADDDLRARMELLGYL